MTTIAALAVSGHVFMAADTVTNVYDRPIVGAVQKIRRVPIGQDGHKGECLIAVCGDGALADMVSHLLVLDSVPAEGDDSQSWAAAVARACTALAVEQGLTEAGRLDGTLLLGWNGQMWSMPHGQAIRHLDGVAALGSGEGPAIGALDALRNQMDPEIAVTTAVHIAIERDKHSMAPVQTETLGPTSTGQA